MEGEKREAAAQVEGRRKRERRPKEKLERVFYN